MKIKGQKQDILLICIKENLSLREIEEKATKLFESYEYH